jgi:hypothetical protein
MEKFFFYVLNSFVNKSNNIIYSNKILKETSSTVVKSQINIKNKNIMNNLK